MIEKIKKNPCYFNGLGYSLFILILGLTVSSCKKERAEVGADHTDGNDFEIIGNNFVPDSDGGVVIPINFDGLDGIDYLLIQKSGGNFFEEKRNREQLTSSFHYAYQIEKDDPDRFQLSFSTYDLKGNHSRVQQVSVINKRGFFIRSLERIARVTGKPLPGEAFPSPNKTSTRWDVGGTDLGIIWEMSPGHYGLFFGDTFGHDFVPDPGSPGPNGSHWRSNVLAFSDDEDLNDGLTIQNMLEGSNGDAKEIIAGHQAGLPTSIPTAAVRIGSTDYVHYFNTDPILAGTPFYFSGLYKSEDNGENWSPVSGVRFPSDSRFALARYFKKGDFVYMMGTPAYRDKPAYLARFKDEDMEDLSKYEYWNGDRKTWIRGDEKAGTVLIPGTVGELSFLYNSTLKKWILVYGDIGHGFVSLRIADDITGPWSEVYELVSPEAYPMHYGPYLHPLSAKGTTLYFTLSMWEPYNVFLMKAEVVDRE